jgi:hypothetical protein
MTERKGKRKERASSWHPHLVEAPKQEVARAASRDPPRRCFASWRKKKMGGFAQRPLAFPGFS